MSVEETARMVAQPQPPRRGSGRGSHRLRAWLDKSSKGSSGGGSSGMGSGALVEPRPPSPPAPPHPPLPLPRTPLFPDDDEDDDLAPTLPRIPSIPRLPVAPTPPLPAARRLTVAGDFASFILTRNYMRGPRLNGLTTEQRMRLFSLVGQLYLPALIVTGRMPACDDLADLADMVGCGCDDEDE